MEDDCRFCPFRVGCEHTIEASEVPPQVVAHIPPARVAPPPPPTPAPARVAQPAPTTGAAPMPPPRAYVQPAAPAAPAATQQPYNYNYGAAYAQRPAAAPAAVVPPGSTVIRPVRFNHEKSLLRQYGTYVMFDVAEVMATRAADLVRSCRDQYERELMEGDD